MMPAWRLLPPLLAPLLAAAHAQEAPPAPDTQVLTGALRERGTGFPIAGAVVQVGSVEVVSAADGTFSIALPPGSARVVVIAEGYARWEGAAPVGAPGEPGAPMAIFLRHEAVDLEVVVEGRRAQTVVSEQKLDREKVLKTPGTFEDPVRLVQSLPSVSVTPEFSPKAGDLSVRGSSPAENRFYLDGIEFPYLYHFNGYASVFHTRLLDELTLYPSTFGADYGGSTGAIVQTRSVWEAPRGPETSVNLNAIMGGVATSLPLGEEWNLRASARRSYLDKFSKDEIQYTDFPVFSDYFARIEYSPNPVHTVALLSFGARDTYTRYAGEPTLLDPVEQEANPSFTFDQYFQAVALQHRSQSESWKANGSLSWTSYHLDGTLPAAAQARTEGTLYAREDALLSLQPRWTLAVGGELRYRDLDLTLDTDRAWVEVARESPLLARGIAVDTSQGRTEGGVYVESRHTIQHLQLLPGARVDADSLTGRAVVDPRMGLRWEPNSRHRVRLAAGRYSAFPSTEALLPALGDPDFGPSHSLQIAGGYDHVFAERLELSLDGWDKQIHDLVLTPVGEAPLGGVDGDAWGVELTSKYRLRDIFFAAVSVAGGQARYTQGGEAVPMDYDQPYAINAVTSWSFRPTWNVGLRYRRAAGLPYTPIDDGRYDASTDTWAPVYGATNSARLPAYQKIDLHAEKRVELRTWSLTPYLEAWYVPSANNAMYVAWSYDYDDHAYVKGPPFLLIPGVRGDF